MSNDQLIDGLIRQVISATRKEAADALEAKDKRIAELEDKLKDEEYVSKDTNEMFHEVRDENVELRARIAVLEAALKDLIEDHEYLTRTDAEDDNLARQAARAALEGKDD